MNEFSLMVFVTGIDITAAVIIFAGALSDRMRLYPVWHKLGLIILMVGLLAQAFRNIQFMVTGVSPTDIDFPLWALKDVGAAIIAWYYFLRAITGVK
jgi:hypothetical protein